MRYYQPTKNNPYFLPRTLYKRMVHLVRDYERLKIEYHDILHEIPSAQISEQSHRTYTSDPTARKAMRLTVVSSDIKAVEQALVIIPPEYRDGIFNNIAYETRYPDNASTSTYRYWKPQFLYHVAKNLLHV